MKLPPEVQVKIQPLDVESLLHDLDAVFHNESTVICCPAHDDHSPSLKITIRDEPDKPDKPLYICFAGCSLPDIMTGLRELADDPIAQANYREGKSRFNRSYFEEFDPPERWQYPDGVYKAAGRRVFGSGEDRLVVRERSKSWMKDGYPCKGSQHWYVPPELDLDGITELRVTASESDADALTAAGYPAVSVPGGDQGPIPDPIWNGDTTVIVIGDNDDSGRNWAQRAAERLGCRHAFPPAAFSDARDALGAENADVASWAAGDTTEPQDTLFADLSWLLSGERPVRPAPSLLRRIDGRHLMYRGAVNGLFGDPEVGKSWVALATIIEELEAGHPAWYIDIDHNGLHAMIDRLLALGAKPRDLADPARFRYFEPDDSNDIDRIVESAREVAAGTVVVDSLGELIPMLGGSSKDNDEITAILRRACQPFADIDWCVITIDHLPKNSESRSNGFAIGGMTKKRVIRGSYLLCERVGDPLAPGRIGKVKLSIAKDTSGGLREHAEGKDIGIFVLDSTDKQSHWRIEVPKPQALVEANREADLDRKVAAFIRDHDGCSARTLRAGIKAKSVDIDAAVARLVSDGYVEIEDLGPGRAKPHRLVQQYPESVEAFADRHEEMLRRQGDQS